MKIKVNLSNILEYGLDVITGNSRADLLARAAEMEKEGYDLFVTIPDVEGGDTEAPKERNVFAHFSDVPDPDGRSHEQIALDLQEQAYVDNPCDYREVFGSQGVHFICNIHEKPSKHSITVGSHEPCLAVDPYDA